MFLYFFFQAEDGIRDADVTGVQTCALPILTAGGGTTRTARSTASGSARRLGHVGRPSTSPGRGLTGNSSPVRSEERRVGRESCFWCWGRKGRGGIRSG